MRRSRALTALTCWLLACGLPTEGQPEGTAPAGKGDLWGADDRIELWQVRDPALRQRAAATVALVPKWNLSCDDEACDVVAPITLGDRYDLCEGVKFRDQPAVVAHFTGVLVERSRVLTVAHWASSLGCNQTYVVFDWGYHSRASTADELLSAVRRIPRDKVYRTRCADLRQVMQRQPSALLAGDSVDAALVTLDREVADREPVPLTAARAPEPGERVTIVGHPMGLPAKVAREQKVFGASSLNLRLEADVFTGNSGSPVFDAGGALVAIVDRTTFGPEDSYEDVTSVWKPWTWNDDCRVPASCWNKTLFGCPSGASAVLTRAIAGPLLR